MSIPTANDIRKYLRGYCVDLEDTVIIKGDALTGSAIIANIDTRSLEKEMRISGAGIPAGAVIQSVDNVGQVGQITISVNATATAAQADLTFTFYTEMTDEWIANRRDGFVIPYVENATDQSISEVTEIEEHYSGNGSSTLILNRRPIISVTNISYTNIPAETTSGNLLLSIDVLKEEGILKSKANFNEGSYDSLFYKGINNIKVKYTYGYATTPIDICELITVMTAKKMLVAIGARTGGGNLSMQSYGKSYGNRGKYTEILDMMDQDAFVILRKYSTGIVGA